MCDRCVVQRYWFCGAHLGLDIQRQGDSSPYRGGGNVNYGLGCSVNFGLVGSVNFEVGDGINFGLGGDSNDAQYWVATQRHTQCFEDKSAEFGEWGKGGGWIDGGLVVISGYSSVKSRCKEAWFGFGVLGFWMNCNRALDWRT
jgi:hypothetical protein